MKFNLIYSAFFLKHNQLCINIWRCFSDDDNDEYDEDQHDIIQQIQELKQQLEQSRNDFEQQTQTHSTSYEQIRNSFEKFIDILVSYLI